MADEAKAMVNFRYLKKEIREWKKQAKEMDLTLTQFVRLCVKEKLRQTKSLPEPEAQPTLAGRRE